MQYRIFIVDAFTSTRFKGNQAAVVPLGSWLPDSLMQSIATENNISETAFFLKSDNSMYEIRWFSPLKEIDFCGHATLASARVIFDGDPALDAISFWAKAVGTIVVKRAADNLIEMCFPNRSPVALESVPQALVNGLSITPQRFFKNQQAYFAVYPSQDDVKNVVPYLDQLKTLGPLDVVVTAPGEEYDFVSRYFWPANGGEEDPVTGSIHAGLAPFWASELGKTQLTALQASTRTGILYCQVSTEHVLVAGHCVHYLEGFINI